MKTETTFRRKVINWLKAELDNIDITSVQQFSLNGTPDLIICLNGFFVAIELKASSGKVSDLQAHKLKKIREKGKGFSFVIHPETWPALQTVLLELDKGKPKYQND